jgi:adenylate cyclase
MTEERARRKLSGILSADAVGYSRLMQEDEASTIRNLEDSKKLRSSLIERFKGRVVDAPGDNLLAEFDSVVDATECAVNIQQELKNKNAELPDNRKMEFRIGVNLGDVVEEADHIYGDGVNIAARLEGLAQPGGICISRTAHDHVKNKLALGYEYLGEHRVKNIAEPVRVYRVLMEPEAAGKVIGEKRFLGRISRKTAMIAIIVLVIVAGGLIGWNIYLYQSKKIEPASLEKMAYPLPDKPSIAVLPFDNMSADPEQEYFSDGLTEEIITALSKNPEIFVIARNSTFTYKEKPVKVQQVAEELGVRYVLEGSVRMIGEKVRITAQLVDAIKGLHLWAERYDRDLKDIFAIQDEITKKIITALQVKLTIGEAAHVYARDTDSLEAYLKLLQAREHHFRFTKEDNLISRRLADEVISIDPAYGQAYVILAATHMLDIWLGATKSPRQSLGKAIELANKAVTFDGATAHAILGWLYVMAAQHDKAIAECQKAIDLDPNSASARGWYGMALRFAGRFEDSVYELEQAQRIDPFSPTWRLRALATSYSFTGRHEEAIATGKKAAQKAPNDQLSHVILALAYSMAGRMEESQTEVSEVLRINPKFSLEYFAKRMTYKNQADKDRVIEALRNAGFK